MLKKKAELDEADRERKRSKKTMAVMEDEKRREGLDKRLDSSNKGFAMLQKMGYKPGTVRLIRPNQSKTVFTRTFFIGEGLGKKDVSGRVDPIPIEVKKDRGGLGREAVLREVTQRKAEFLKRRMLRQKEQGLQVSAQEFRYC